VRLHRSGYAVAHCLKDVSESAWVSFCCGWRWGGRMVLPCRRVNSRGCHCGALSSPFFERPIPAKVNQSSNNKYFDQQSHTKTEIRRRPWLKATLIFVGTTEVIRLCLWLRPTSRPRLHFCVVLRRGMAFDQDHVCPGCAMAHFAWFAVLFTIKPFLGTVS
jgi:hypothetical protein